MDTQIDGIVTKYSEVRHNLQDIDDEDKHLILGHLAASIAIAYEDEAVVNPSTLQGSGPLMAQPLQ